MTAGPTRYDAVRYPGGVYPASDPSRLAALARLHGLVAPDPARARVLEIAGGDGINLIAMAAGWPDARFTSFDLAPSAVERGRALAAAAGLGNVEIIVGDVLDCAENLAGSYDYIIVHGLYAWVPEAVRAATLRLIGRVLAADGVAFVSYNALPGGYLRQAVRAMLLHHLGDEPDPARRLALAYEKLEQFIVAQPTDSAALTGLRQVAEPMLRKTDGGLFHDELGDVFAPQLLVDVVAAAARHGLAYLNDATPAMICEGLRGADVAEADVVPGAQADDFTALAFFHRTLFVRAGRHPARGIVPAHFRGLLATTELRPVGPGQFRAGETALEFDDARLAALLAAMAKAAPWRVPLDPIADSTEHCQALIELCRRDCVTLHAAQLPARQVAGTHPQTSGLARAQLAQGLGVVHTLDLRTIVLAEPGVRHFVMLLDGTRDRATLARDWQASAYADEIDSETALLHLVQAGLLVA